MIQREIARDLGWVTGLLVFVVTGCIVVREIREFGLERPGVLLLTMLFTAGPVLIIGLWAVILSVRVSG